MYAVYYSWTDVSVETQSVLWHPADFPSLTEEEARRAAAALKQALPNKRWAFGPRYRDGIMEVA